MFSSRIDKTPFTESWANDLFPKIEYDQEDAIWVDATFITNLTILLDGHKKDDSTFLYSSALASPDAVLSSIRMTMGNGGDSLQLFLSQNGWHDSALLPGKIKALGFEEVGKVYEFYKAKFEVHCFINREERMSVLLVSDNNFDIRKYHHLQCAIPAMLPWYFNEQEGLTDKEIALLYAMREQTSVKWMSAVSDISDHYNFEELKVRKLLARFESKQYVDQLHKAESKYESVMQCIQKLNEELVSLLTKKRELTVSMTGLREIIANSTGDGELANYFAHAPNLHLQDVKDDKIEFVVTGYLNIFDPDEAEHAIENESSYVYESHPLCSTEGRSMQKLMREIFVSDEPRLKVRVKSAYRLGMDGTAGGLKGYNYPEEYESYVANPHINRYACLGGYESLINQLLQNGEMMGAVSQCVASAQSIGFNDPSMSYFMVDMYSNKKFIELPNGKVVSPADAQRWLEREDG